MSVKVITLKNIINLENDIFRRENELGQDQPLSTEEARKFYNRLVSCQLAHAAEYKTETERLWNEYSDDVCLSERDFIHLNAVEYVEKKMMRLEKHLSKFFKPVNTSISSTELKVTDQNNQNDQPHATVNLKLNSLFQKQKFFIEMIDSLAPECEISSKDAELQYEHLLQFYEKFISNQSEITTFLKDDAFDVQVNISKEIHRKVLSMQKTLKEIFSPTKPTALPEFIVNEHFNRTNRPNVIADFLESQFKKQKSLIEQIELIESKNDPSAAEAETLHNHVSQLYDTFIENQRNIEKYVEGLTLDKELEMSRVIRVKVMSLQTKLKEIFVPVESPSLVEPKPVDESKQMKESDKVIYLNSLIEKQKSMMNEIKSISVPAGMSQPNYVMLSQRLAKREEWFFENQQKIEELIDGFDLHQQKQVSANFQSELESRQRQCEFYLERCASSKSFYKLGY